MEQKPITYCTRCLYPSTKPDLLFNDGVCNACTNFDSRKDIDFEAREKEFLAILDRYRSKDGSNYDCIIPVSGGKDSTFQVIKMLEYGMKPLCVTGSTCMLADIGRRNIENIKDMGVDYVEITINPVMRRKANRIALEKIGDISWVDHLRIFTTPVKVAVEKKVPLLIWGECSENEYGGPASSAKSNTLDRKWMEEFGTRGLRLHDIVGQEGITERDLIPLQYPSQEELDEVGVTGLFLGYYIPWDGYRNSLVAQAHGFETFPTRVEGNLVNYENLDNVHHGVHDYFKFLKYGFCRVTDLASMHIRRGRMTRAEGMEVVKKYDGEFPNSYLGVPLQHLLEDIDMSMEQFTQICDDFTNKKLFVCDRRGNLVKDRHGNLTKINYDNVTTDHEHRSDHRLQTV